ncbi:hypothetical protein DM860_002863 [Cuscuta australis]|uniref:Uncharacterized protein n=1 Tax=Cuscuta australis TaxID=267555 RepID=A0A328D2M3_9ASTE|nr:hypothetical protein DM860_002863 [Cuscuta australis]
MVDNGYEFSSPLSFPSSSCVSNGSSGAPHEAKSNLELLSLSKLSNGLERLLVETEFGLYCDWEIVVEGVRVGVNRCILAARSRFFHEKFKTAMAEGKPPKFVMTDLLPRPLGWVGFEAFEVLLNYLYTGKLKVSPPEVSTCVDESCVHLACRPAINYAVGLLYASSTFQMNELVMLLQHHLVDLVDKALAEDVIPILMVAYHCSLTQLLERCLETLTRSDLENFTLEKELHCEIFNNIKARRLKSQQQQQLTLQAESIREKRIKRILKALDCDDVDLLKLLLAESTVTLDDACALHYAVAYCNPKVVMEVLGLCLADVNLFNPRGYTPLHLAARRKDPEIIVGLLKHGASVGYGHDVVATCRRVTRPKDYNEPTKQGQETNNGRLCIDVLEREMMSRNPADASLFLSSSTVDDELFMGLYLLENRVALARQLFPREARLAMEQAEADSTLEFAGLSSTNGHCGNPRGRVGFNDLPSDQVRKLKERHEALQKTVATGQRFFPNCSKVLDRLLEDEVLECLMLESGTAEEQRFKKARYIELKEEVHNAFVKDKAEHKWSLSHHTSSSSTSTKSQKVRKRYRPLVKH